MTWTVASTDVFRALMRGGFSQSYANAGKLIIDQSDSKLPVVERAPKIVVDNGQSGTLKDQTQRAFVTGVTKTKTGLKPTVKAASRAKG